MARGSGVQHKYHFTSGDRAVICPKPRRPDSGDHLRRTLAQLTVPLDSKPASSPHIYSSKIAGEPLERSDTLQQFFCGSPPTRSANPVVLDTRFSHAIPLRPAQRLFESGSDDPQTGFDGARFGLTPDVRIEGFDCLGCNCSRTRGIPAVA